MNIDRAKLSATLAEHGPVIRVVVLSTRGSVPREAGAAMLVWETGQSGTIGGGALEYDATAEARRMLGGQSNTLVQTKPLGPALGQCCGGSVTLLLERFASEDLPDRGGVEGVFMRPVKPDAASVVPATLLRSASEAPDAPIFADGWVAETMSPRPMPVWIYGAGHVGRALASVLAPLSQYTVTLIDTCTEKFPESLPEGVVPAIAANPASLSSYAPPDAHHLVMTYSHALDLELCHSLLSRPFASLGLIGSATKWARFKKRLASLGHTKTQINRITCPIGDPALGKEPQAIAISVAQTFLQMRTQLDTPKEIAS